VARKLSTADGVERKVDLLIKAIEAVQEELKQNDKRLGKFFEDNQRDLCAKMNQELMTQTTQLAVNIGKQIGEQTAKIESLLKETDKNISQNIEETKKISEVVIKMSGEITSINDLKLKYANFEPRLKTMEDRFVALGFFGNSDHPYDKKDDPGSSYKV